ncbi:MAG: Galactokinase [Gemmatimonadaceae bacterium]|nr:Galactokinase [Gemmatimonadaceae bacterium]
MSAERAAATYRRAFGEDPAVVASAPGRVNLIGEHTDYNGGDVLPMALSLRTSVAVGPSTDALSHAVSEQSPRVGAFSPTGPSRSSAWWDYVAGTMLALGTAGVAPRPLRIAVASDVPSGAGLSSSAALEVATAFALNAWSGGGLDARTLARVAHRAETEFVGVPCGIMDQYVSSLAREGHALLVACDREEATLVPMAATVLIFDTRTPRSLRTSAFAQRRHECEIALRAIQRNEPAVRWLSRASEEQVRRATMDEIVRKRALHVVRETARVAACVRTLRETGRLAGDSMYASHASLRDDYQCSTPELDWFVDRAQETRGVTGARLTGAGWGGCAIAAGAPGPLRQLADSAMEPFATQYRRRPRFWMSAASDGARVDVLRENLVGGATAMTLNP